MPQPGDLDTTFDGNGKKQVNFGGRDEPHAVLVQPNGRIIVAGGGAPANSFCVVRLRSNGAFDTTFGSGGQKLIDFGSDNEAAWGAALQPDGKIVLAGDSSFKVAVARLNPNGSLDRTFSGDGKKVFSWGVLSRAMAPLVLPNGKIVLAGFSGPEGGNVQVARLNANGSLDKTFGTDGKVAIDFGGDDFGLAAARQANGRILVAGQTRPTFGGQSTAIVVRLRTTGVLDPDFDGDGQLMLPGMEAARAVLVQPDRKIVVAGYPPDNSVMLVKRLNPNGTPDTTFDGDGTAAIDVGPGTDEFANATALQGDGKIVLAGYVQGALVAVARLNPNGSPDTTFSADGRTTIDFGFPTFGEAVALQPNGRIVVAGQLVEGTNTNFGIARVLG
jgi:uncharacterized delta-60 repeat protein